MREVPLSLLLATVEKAKNRDAVLREMKEVTKELDPFVGMFIVLVEGSPKDEIAGGIKSPENLDEFR